MLGHAQSPPGSHTANISHNMAHVKNLFCQENFQETHRNTIFRRKLLVPAHPDRVLTKDSRVFENLLNLEKVKKVTDYCESIQTEIAPHMRKIVTDWMLEVCEDQHCQPEVFFLAVNYLDRFLSLVNIKKSQFQLLASVCILLSSKFSQVVPVTTDQIVIYTDSSVSVEDVRKWEIFVLEVLQWELSTATANSFLQHFCTSFKVDDQTKKQAENIATMAMTEYNFLLAKDSVLAGASLAAAIRNQIQSSEEMIPIINHISNTIKCNTKDLFICMYYLTNDDQYETKTKEMPEDGRPNTPDDMLNISQTEITVL